MSVLSLFWQSTMNMHEVCIPLLASATVHLYFGSFSISVLSCFSELYMNHVKLQSSENE